jgi:hypothetical protein
MQQPLRKVFGRYQGAGYPRYSLSSTVTRRAKIRTAHHPRLALADDIGDGSSLRGSGNSDKPARRCRPELNKFIGLHCSFRNPTAEDDSANVSRVPGGPYMWKSAMVAAALFLPTCAADEEQRKAQREEFAKAAAEAEAQIAQQTTPDAKVTEGLAPRSILIAARL